MSRKTRREKMLAQQHRQEKIAFGSVGQFSLPQTEPQQKPVKTTPSAYSLVNAVSPTVNITRTGIVDYQYIKTDLLRIFLITIAAFLFEGTIFFIWK